MIQGNSEVTGQPPIIEWEQLLERCMGRIDLMERVLSRFQDSAEQELDRITAALERQDLSQVLAGAHKVKGTALTVSASRFATCAERLHAAAAAQQPSQCLDYSRGLRSELETLRATVSAHQSGAADGCK